MSEEKKRPQPERKPSPDRLDEKRGNGGKARETDQELIQKLRRTSK